MSINEIYLQMHYFQQFDSNTATGRDMSSIFPVDFFICYYVQQKHLPIVYLIILKK